MKTLLAAVVLIGAAVAGYWWFYVDHGPRYTDPMGEFSFVIPNGWQVVYGDTKRNDKEWNGFLGDPYLIPINQTLIKPTEGAGAYIHFATSSDSAKVYQLYPGDRTRGNTGPSQAQFDKNWSVSNDRLTDIEKGSCETVTGVASAQEQTKVAWHDAIRFSWRCQPGATGGYFSASEVWIRTNDKAYVVDVWATEPVETSATTALDEVLTTWRFKQ